MSCPSLEELEGEDEAARAHLRGCPTCQRTLAAADGLDELLSEAAAWDGLRCLTGEELLASLGGAPRGPLSRHLERCPACAAERQALVTELEVEPAPALVRRLTALRPGSRSLRRPRNLTRRLRKVPRRGSPLPAGAWAGLAAAAVLLLLALLGPRPTPELERAEAPAPASGRASVERPAPPPAPRVGPAPRPEPEPGRPEPAPAPPAPREVAPSRARTWTGALDDGGELGVSCARLLGQVERGRGDGSWTPLQRGAGEVALQAGERLRVAGPAGAFLVLDEGAAELCLSAGSELEVRATQRGPVLGLRAGRVQAEVLSLRPGRRFEVETLDGRCAVVGTRFQVEAELEGARVAVAEGAVAVANSRGQVEVAAGAATRLSGAEAPAAPTPLADDVFAWADDLRPGEELRYEETFEGAAPWSGSPGPAPGGRSGQAWQLQPLQGDERWGLRAETAAGFPGLAVEADGTLSLALWSERDTTVSIQAVGASSGKRYQAEYELRAGRWRTITLRPTDLSTAYDPGADPVRTGDRFVSLAICAGAPGERFQVALDDLRARRRTYR